MPNTKPGVVFSEEGICPGCKYNEKKKVIDWDKRFEELKQLCDKYRGKSGDYYDCIIPVSGGKDSYYQVYVMKELMGMNPLLVNVSNFSWTKAGLHNFNNITEAFGCDMISLHLNRKVAKKMLRKGLEKFGQPTWYWDRAVYVYPIRMAIKLNIPLIVYGENTALEYGGVSAEETYSAKNQINNESAKSYDFSVWLDEDIKMKDLNFCVYPTEQEIAESGIDPVYLSYFFRWDDYRNYQVAKRYGFKTLAHEWQREGFVNDYIQIDALGYLVHAWMRYPKFGYSVVTNTCNRWIRNGRMTREEAVDLVNKHEGKLDQKVLQDFLDFTGYSHKEFWDIVEKFWNRDVFEKINEEWKLKVKLT